MAYAVSSQELHGFHTIDRQIYSRLVLDLHLDSNLAQKSVAFWYWLERKGQRCFINVIRKISDRCLFQFAVEAKICLDCLANELSVAYNADLYFGFPLMRSFFGGGFSVAELCQDRENALKLIDGYFKYLCDYVFKDIVPSNQSPVQFIGFPVQWSNVYFPTVLPNGVGFSSFGDHVVQPQPVAPVQAIAANGVHVLSYNEQKVESLDANEAKVPCFMPNGAQVLVPNTMANGVQDLVPNTMANGVHVPSYDEPKVESLAANEVKVPCFMANGAQVLVPNTMANGVQDLVPNSVANGDQISPNARNLQALIGRDENRIQNLVSVQENDRTLFITFSKGHSAISKNELRDLITRKFGNCVESIHLRGDSLYALVVVKSASALTNILQGKVIVKLSIDGKDVWVRRYIKKQDDSSSSGPM